MVRYVTLLLFSKSARPERDRAQRNACRIANQSHWEYHVPESHDTDGDTQKMRRKKSRPPISTPPKVYMIQNSGAVLVQQ